MDEEEEEEGKIQVQTAIMGNELMFFLLGENKKKKT